MPMAFILKVKLIQNACHSIGVISATFAVTDDYLCYEDNVEPLRGIFLWKELNKRNYV